jgi:hypothetical protein
MSTSANEVQVPAAQDTPRNICIIIFLNLYGSWQANSIFTAGAFGCLSEEGQIGLYTPHACYFGPLRYRAGPRRFGCWLYGGWHKAGIRLENPARPEPELSRRAGVKGVFDPPSRGLAMTPWAAPANP